MSVSVHKYTYTQTHIYIYSSMFKIFLITYIVSIKCSQVIDCLFVLS